MHNDRQQRILEKLRQQGFVSVEELCRTLYSSSSTIRRDLAQLENQGILKRVRGGAITFNGINSDLPTMLRNNTNVEAKKHIAWLAAAYVNDSMTLFLDSSSTSKFFAQEITEKQNLSIITNSLEISYILSSGSQVKVYASGGHVRNNSTMVGSAALKMVQDRYADIFFFSCSGLSLEHGTSETNEDSVEIKRAMFANSTKRILLCDHSKFDITYSYKCFELDRVDFLITDRKPPQKFIDRMPASMKLIY